MADNPPTPIDAELTAARAAGAHNYIAAADKLLAAGHAIPYAHRRDVEQVRAAVARSRQAHGPSEEAILRSGLAPADARDAALANRLLAAGVDPKRVAEAIGSDPTEWREERTPAQIEHDRRHGITRVINPNAYYAPLPLGVDLPPAGAQQLDADARDLASSLGMAPAVGNAFIKNVYAAGANTEDREQWEKTLAAVYPGEKLAEAEKAIDELLETYAPDSELVKRLKQYGTIRNPLVFRTLHNRARAITAWAAGRPE